MILLLCVLCIVYFDNCQSGGPRIPASSLRVCGSPPQRPPGAPKINIFCPRNTKNQYFLSPEHQKSIFSIPRAPKINIFCPRSTKNQYFLSLEHQKSIFSIPEYQKSMFSVPGTPKINIFYPRASKINIFCPQT